MARPQLERHSERKERMLHIRLDADLHQRLRLIAAAEDTSLQDWIRRALEQASVRALSKVTRKAK
jgi:predicted HicB family RNase H-like nuclease